MGAAPAVWARELDAVPNANTLPIAPINRQEVQNVCGNPNTNVLYAYVCAMAWGGQNNRFANLGNPGHKTLAWKHRQLIAQKLEALRNGGLNHSQAYDLFSGENSVPGLGPAFFTKLIYFFSPRPPEGSTGFYIMDQWTAKSVNFLTQQWVVQLARTRNTSPGQNNRCGNYEAFCREVEHIAAALELNGPNAGDQVEQRLMSKGGHHPQPWRYHVRTNWPRHCPQGLYNKAALHAN